MTDIQFRPGDGNLRRSSRSTTDFQRDWDSLCKRVDHCILNLSSEVCKNIKDYIFKTYDRLNRISSSQGLITTALLQTSVNVPDHMKMFHNLKRNICSIGGHVAIIEPGSNVSTAKNLFAIIVQKFLFDEESLGATSSAQEFLNKLPPSLRSSLSAVSAWYYIDHRRDLSKHLQELSLESPVKTIETTKKVPKSKKLQDADGIQTHRGPLVVVIPAIEKFPSHVLQKLVKITSLYVQKRQNQRHLPIFFVFGLSSTEELALDCQFDAQTLACLAIQRFKLPPPAVFVKSLFNELFNFPGFRASGQVIRYLIEQVHNCLDFSVANLLNHYKLAMHRHYLTLRHPKLLASIGIAEKYITSLKDDTLSSILSEYPSFARLREDEENVWAVGAVAQLAIGSLNETSFRNKLLNVLSVHWLLQLILPFILKWVFFLFKDVHGYSENSYPAEAYCDWMAGRLLTKDLIQRFNALDSKRVISSVEASIDYLNEALAVLKSEIPSKKTKGHGHAFLIDDPYWAPFHHQAVSLLSELHSAVNDWLYRLSAASTTSTPQPLLKPAPELRRRMTLNELKERLLKPRHSARDGSPSVANGPKTWMMTMNEFSQWLCLLLSPRGDNEQSVLPSPLSLPLHEIFYGSPDPTTVTEFKRSVDPQLVGSIHRTLAHLDEFTVERHWTREVVLGLRNRHPDLCIVYKLLCESGSMLSLYDLLVSYSSIVEPSSDRISQTTQARFLRAVSELEILGFVRYTERRTDHAMKNPLMELVANLIV